MLNLVVPRLIPRAHQFIPKGGSSNQFEVVEQGMERLRIRADATGPQTR